VQRPDLARLRKGDDLRWRHDGRPLGGDAAVRGRLGACRASCRQVAAHGCHGGDRTATEGLPVGSARRWRALGVDRDGCRHDGAPQPAGGTARQLPVRGVQVLDRTQRHPFEDAFARLAASLKRVARRTRPLPMTQTPGSLRHGRPCRPPWTAVAVRPAAAPPLALRFSALLFSALLCALCVLCGCSASAAAAAAAAETNHREHRAHRDQTARARQHAACSTQQSRGSWLQSARRGAPVRPDARCRASAKPRIRLRSSASPRPRIHAPDRRAFRDADS
jgi:hypothetical protein